MIDCHDENCSHNRGGGICELVLYPKYEESRPTITIVQHSEKVHFAICDRYERSESDSADE